MDLLPSSLLVFVMQTNVKVLLLTMAKTKSIDTLIEQTIQCDNRICECNTKHHGNNFWTPTPISCTPTTSYPNHKSLEPMVLGVATMRKLLDSA